MLSNMTYLIRIFLLTVFLLFSASGNGQEAKATINPEQIAIGQQSSLQLKLSIPAGSTLIWPALGDTLTQDIEIVHFGRPDTLLKNDQELVLLQEHSITAWEEGFYPIPPIAFGIIYRGDTIHFQSEALLLQATGVSLDPDAPPKDIKPVLSWPVTFGEVLPYMLLALLLIIVGFYTYRWLAKRKKHDQKEDIREKPDIPAHIAALSGLENLRSKKLWQKGQLKTYHSELTDILRKYLKKRFAVDATEMTTAEIMDALQDQLNDTEKREWLLHILSLADLVKFAKHQPDAAENEQVMDQAVDLVQKTKQIIKDAD